MIVASTVTVMSQAKPAESERHLIWTESKNNWTAAQRSEVLSNESEYRVFLKFNIPE